jgi:alpha-galactosidase/6-phospho-beta-glucosidase family protein
MIALETVQPSAHITEALHSTYYKGFISVCNWISAISPRLIGQLGHEDYENILG